MNKRILLYFTITILTLSSCIENKNDNKTENKGIENKQKSYITDEKIHSSWSNNKTNNNYDNQRIVFFKDSLSLYFRDGSCSHNFKTEQTNTKRFYQIWSMRNNCEYRKNIFEELDNINLHPKEGDRFAEYVSLNDSTFEINYKFKQWVKEINKKAKDSIFPKYLFRVKE